MHTLKNNSDQPLLWGILHGLNDFVAGYMLARYATHHNYADSFTILVIYAILGFGGQLPVGLLLDRQKQLKPFAIVSIALLIISTAMYFADPFTAIIITGFAGAGIHVTGGAICLQVSEKSGPLGIFTAPGVLGLTLGGILGTMSPAYLIIVFALVITVAILILKKDFPVYQAAPKEDRLLDTHDLIMMGILLIMCFRSFIFDVMNSAAFHFENGVLVFGISAFFGKIIGGALADKIGWKKFIYITLPLAFLLFQFGKENLYAMAFGIACLQSSVPLTLLMISRSLPLFPATATALSLGTSVALAGLPLYISKTGTGSVPSSLSWLLVFIAMILGWIVVSVMKKRPLSPKNVLTSS
jgi:FSR family fosmidomycin resistance protein-like MFS transporter